MTNEIAKYEEFFSSAPVLIDQAKTTDEIQAIIIRAKALTAAARIAKDHECEEKLKNVTDKALRALGVMMAAHKDAGLLNEGGRPCKTTGVSDTPVNPTLAQAGIDKNLAKAARKAYPEGWPSKAKPAGGIKLQEAKDKIFAYEAAEGKRSPKTERHFQMDGVTPSTRIALIREVRGARTLVNDELAIRARIVELETENARLKNDLEALQTGNLMQMSRTAVEQRRALIEKMKVKREQRKAVETIPDEKTKEGFERQIKNLNGQLKSAKSTVMAFMANGKTVLDRDARKAILVCLHPDGAVDPNEKTKREKAFKLFTAAVPEPEF